MSSRLRSSSVGAEPQIKPLARSRAESTIKPTLEVRCGCQYFMSDSLLPDRINPIGSRPQSKLDDYPDLATAPISTPPPLPTSILKSQQQLQIENQITNRKRSNSQDKFSQKIKNFFRVGSNSRSSTNIRTISFDDVNPDNNKHHNDHNDNDNRMSPILFQTNNNGRQNGGKSSHSNNDGGHRSRFDEYR